MEQTLICINHPGEETRVRCGACDRPICVRCMRESSVGMKCPDCARLPRRAVRIGKPRHYIAASAAAFAAAALLGGFVTWFMIPFWGFILPLLAGFAIGSIARKVSGGVRHAPIQALVGLATAIGLTAGRLAAGLPLTVQLRGSVLLGTILASAFAAITVGR